MKKVLLTLALAAFAFTANAQWVVGGTVSANHANGHSDKYVAGNTITNITLLPKVGYQLNDKMQVGLLFGWTFNYTRTYNGADDNYTSNSNPGNANITPTTPYTDYPQIMKNPTITIAPYFRYNLTTWKNFTIFAEAQLNVGIHMESSRFTKTPNGDTSVDQKDNFTSFGLSVVPGLNYSLTDKISLDLYVNLVRCYADFYTADNYGGHAWGIGADMSAQTLNDHLGNFSLGFNYHF